MLSVFKISFLLTILTAGIFLFFGFLYNFLEKRNTTYVLSTFGNSGILFTGIIGTTVHELGHLIMCILFHHKINDFKLFNLRGYKYEEVLGYVSHNYNNKSLYEKAGNFFIGIGPILFGTLFIILSFKILLPDLFFQLNINEYMRYINSLNINSIVLLFLHICRSLFILLFNINNLYNIKFYIFIYLMFSISSHISLSRQDLQNSIAGIFSIFIIYFIICLGCILLNFNLNSLLFKIMSYSLYLVLFLSIGLIFSLISLIISFIFYKIKNIIFS